jgi:hypothetical protein
MINKVTSHPCSHPTFQSSTRIFYFDPSLTVIHLFFCVMNMRRLQKHRKTSVWYPFCGCRSGTRKTQVGNDLKTPNRSVGTNNKCKTEDITPVPRRKEMLVWTPRRKEMLVWTEHTKRYIPSQRLVLSSLKRIRSHQNI